MSSTRSIPRQDSLGSDDRRQATQHELQKRAPKQQNALLRDKSQPLLHSSPQLTDGHICKVRRANMTIQHLAASGGRHTLYVHIQVTPVKTPTTWSSHDQETKANVKRVLRMLDLLESSCTSLGYMRGLSPRRRKPLPTRTDHPLCGADSSL